MLNKTYIIAAVLFISMAIAFLMVSLLLNVKNNNPKLIKRKLKLGAAMLTLTAIMNGCVQQNTEEISCYAAVVIEDTIKNIEVQPVAVKKDTIYKKFVKSAINDLKWPVIIKETMVSCYDISIDPPIVKVDTFIITPPDDHINLCYMPIDNFNDTL